MISHDLGELNEISADFRNPVSGTEAPLENLGQLRISPVRIARWAPEENS
jgi:hypothetical protein